MKVIWCAISAHGYGHAAQVISVLNEWGKHRDDLHVILRTTVTPPFFSENLKVSWEIQGVQQDIGCIQDGPLQIDVLKTWDAYTVFHNNWDQKIVEEAKAIQEANPALVLSNISYLGIAAAERAQIPSVALASLSWDQALLPYVDPQISEHQEILKVIRQGYSQANSLIRLIPGIEMPTFQSVIDVGPIVPNAPSVTKDLKGDLGLSGQTPLVVLAFGGIPLTNLPLKDLDALAAYHFIVSGLPDDLKHAHIHRVEDLGMPFGEIVRQADIIMTKPGYATTISAVHYGIPMVYVRRHNFIDEPVLVDYLSQFGRGVELSQKDFERGQWAETLHRAISHPQPKKRPPLAGNKKAADLLQAFL